MNKHYQNLSCPPADAIKKIDGGKLKGFSDINPQWRYEALTNEFGLCGFGWKFEIANTFTEAVPATQELMIFVQVNLYIKEGEQWSDPISGFGGDFLIVKDKNGIHGNDEGYKMAITDALGSAAKVVGVAADVYRGRMDSKYSARGKQAAPAPKKADNRAEYMAKIKAAMQSQHISPDDGKAICRLKFGANSTADLNDSELKDLAENIVNYAVELMGTDDEKLMEGV